MPDDPPTPEQVREWADKPATDWAMNPLVSVATIRTLCASWLQQREENGRLERVLAAEQGREGLEGWRFDNDIDSVNCGCWLFRTTTWFAVVGQARAGTWRLHVCFNGAALVAERPTALECMEECQEQAEFLTGGTP